VFRPDACGDYRGRFPELDDWCGFVCIAPVPTRHGDVRALCLDFEDSGDVWIKVPVASEVLEGPRLVRQLLKLLPSARYRDALEEIGAALDQAQLFANCIEEYEDERIGQDARTSILACDQSYFLNGSALLVQGWIGIDPLNLSHVELVTPAGDIDVTSLVRRTMRPDIAARFPWAGVNPAGFLLLIEGADLVGQPLRMRVRGSDGRRQLSRLSPTAIDWKGVADLVSANPVLERPLVELLSGTSALEPDGAHLQDRIASLRSDAFRARFPQLPVYVENPGTMIGAVDSAYVLGDAGILIFGWRLTPVRKPQRVTLRSDDGQVLDVTGNFTRLVRLDVLQSFQSRFPAIDEWLGYVCFAEMPTSPGEGRALSFDFGEQGDVWFKVPTENHQTTAVGLIRSVLQAIPAPDRMRHTLYSLFSGGLGSALEAVNRSRPPFGGNVEERQFGAPLMAPTNSLIVPLYGRSDFLRHQLAQFADDPDFAHTELLYVVDDPALVSETLELAARYAPLFRVPFRVLWYGENRGFAGANNIGARAARGENLLLVNSDVIPQRPGWISTLAAALHELPDAGAVGPLLLFGDESVQHAGMYPRTDDIFPGFLLNTHKGMGTAWEGGDAPSEHPMLTAACLMLKKCDFEAVGGFDEGYVIGDFEDSDLCLALRKRGKRTWLVPAARLWHLERQSQNLGQAIGERQLVTLFNGWRYMEKIRAGDIYDPRTVERSE
jgi:GT2 family glycosyltransferase